VLDLFAGTGALGLEALSRGAKFALFVDEGAEARGLIRANVEALSLTGVTKIFRRDASKMGEIGALTPFDVVFCDPPYGKGFAEKSLASLREGNWLAPGALLVVEEAVKSSFKTPEGFEELERREYGDSEIVIARLAAPE
jgi:16S rRNA (guanine966-N2)-methyltransferase